MLNAVNPIMTGIRSIFIVFDLGIYYLLRFVYELFFNIATFNIVDRELIFHLFSRVQLIIGVFMVFQLTMTIIKGIVNPDSFTDTKSGAGNLVMRIMVSLTLLALIVPLNISSPRNEYEKQINNNGILFGTLYSLQYRVLSNNTLGKLILGDDATNYTSSDPDNDSLSDFANRFTSVIVKSFYQLNVDEDGNYVCSDGFDDEYNDEDVSPFTIITHGVTTCDSTLGIGGSYALSMSILSTLAGGIIAVLLFMMTFNVAKRVFQLAALQLMAPIPIISYMDPKGSKDSAFNSWLKLLGSTYLELFIQLAVIYFAFGIIKSFMERFPELMVSTAVTALENDAFTSVTMLEWTFIIMVIALFIFAKDAPKFFKQMLGMKDNGGGFFSAFGTALGLGATAIGAVGSINSSRQASRSADLARARANGMNEAQAQAYANSMGNRAKHALSGLFGGAVGVATGSAAASESKGNGLAKTMAAMNAMNNRNAKVRAAGLDGGTFWGGVSSLGREAILGQNRFDELEAGWKMREQHIKNEQAALKTRQDALKTAESNNAYLKSSKDRADDKAIKQDVTRAMINGFRGVSGTTYSIAGINAEAYNSAYKSAQDQGFSQFTITDDTNRTITVDMDDALQLQRKIVDGNAANYYDRVVQFERDYQANITAGMDETAATAAAEGAGGINDTSILADRQGYRDSTGQDMPDTYENSGDVIGLKVTLGNNSNANKAESNAISRISQDLSRRSQEINDERQGFESQRAAANAKRFRNK